MNTCSNSGRVFFFCLLVLLIFSCATEAKRTEQSTQTKQPVSQEHNLVALIKARDLEGIKAHFNTDDVNTKDEQGVSVLHLAVLQDDPETVSYLLQLGASIEELDPFGRTPLVAAAAENSFGAAHVLATHNAQLFAVDSEGLSAFQILVQKKKASTVLNARTVIQKDSRGQTPLHHAVRILDQHLVSEILAAAGSSVVAIVRERDMGGQTALELAYQSAEQKEAAVIADLLLRSGAEPIRGSFAAFETASVQHNYNLRFDNGNTVLHIEAAAGHTGFVLFLIDKGIAVDSKNIAHTTALHEAVRNGHTAVVAALLEAGAKPNTVAALGNTALHLAITSSARTELLPLLLAHRANPVVKDEYGETPLHVAVRIGADIKSLTALLQAGAVVNERNKKGETPLLLAIERHLKDQTELLIRFGADIHSEDIQKRTPLVEALRHHQQLLTSLLIEKKVAQQDSKGRNALHLAVLLNTPTDVIRLLIERNIAINAGDKAGNTPLHYAVANNKQEIGAILLQSGADIFLTNKQGESPLKLACTKGDSRERWMLTPETVGRTDINGCTVLHYAASWGMYRIIPLIVQQGGKVNVKNTRGETPLVSAVKTDNAETVRALFETETMGGEPLDSYSRDFLGDTALHTAVGWRALGAAEVVLQKTRDSGLLIGAKNAAGKTALHVAAQHGDIPFLNLLLAYGADVNIEDREGKTPLIDALLYDKNTTVLFLLKVGASSARQDIQGRTALHEAVASAPPIIIQELRQAGADPLARDSFGNTPLALVLRSGRPILDVLLGNNSLITNSDGDTPLHIAVQENADFDILRYLILKGYPIDKRNRMGITALTLAAKQGAAELCAVLIDSGADVFAADNEGESAVRIALTRHIVLLPLIQRVSMIKTDGAGNSLFHYAAQYAAPETVRLLLDTENNGSEQKNIAGDTPADIAIRWGRTEIAEIFRSNTGNK